MTVPMPQYHELLAAAREVVFERHMKARPMDSNPADARLSAIVNLIDHDRQEPSSILPYDQARDDRDPHGRYGDVR